MAEFFEGVAGAVVADCVEGEEGAVVAEEVGYVDKAFGVYLIVGNIQILQRRLILQPMT